MPSRNARARLAGRLEAGPPRCPCGTSEDPLRPILPAAKSRPGYWQFVTFGGWKPWRLEVAIVTGPLGFVLSQKRASVRSAWGMM